MTVAVFLTKAKENLQAAQLLFEHKLYNASTNRAYYAAFQAAIAALVAEGIINTERVGHDTVQAKFTGELINRKKKYPSGLKPYLAELYRLRQDADYTLKSISEKLSKEQLRKAREFVEEIEKGIQGCSSASK